MGKHRQLPGGYTQVADLCEAERDIHEAMGIMELIVKTVTLPAQALTLMLKVTFVLFKALTSIQRARDIARGARGQGSEEE